MTNQQLLEAVAKKIGIKFSGYDTNKGLLIEGPMWFVAPGSNWWNPLDDDGDAFRLLVYTASTLVYYRYNLPKAAEIARYALVKSVIGE